MAHYHVFMLDEEGQVVRTYAFEAPSDSDALAQVQAKHRTDLLEVWTGERLIGRVAGGVLTDP